MTWTATAEAGADAGASVTADAGVTKVAPVLTLGPPPSSAAPAEREQALRDLLEGRVAVEQLPLVSTPEGVAYDPSLFRDLTTNREASGHPRPARTGPTP
jgi:hypothetical protein